MIDMHLVCWMQESVISRLELFIYDIDRYMFFFNSTDVSHQHKTSDSNWGQLRELYFNDYVYMIRFLFLFFE